MVTLADSLAAVRGRIAAACRAAGRDPGSVRLVAASKTQSAERVAELHAAGLGWFGENRVQELVEKTDALTGSDGLPGSDGLHWAMIGHLQTNKAREVADRAEEFQALDSRRVAEALDRRLQALGRSLDVLVQVNSSGEDSKYGLPPEEVPGFLRQLHPYGSLRVRGLMTLAVYSPDPAQVGACFARMRDLQARLRDTDDLPGSYDDLSMGMSGDYEQAIGYGATTVRVGQALFGARS